jgi:isopentenyl-diphosphate delta-isomerase
MDELIDILDKKGIYTGSSCLKSEAHRKGLWHPCVQIWLYSKTGDVLIQKRSPETEAFPNLWDVSVAGHIGAGENPLVAAQREVSEEVGLTLQLYELKFIGNYSTDIKHSVDLIDREFHYVYIAELIPNVNELVLQSNEVSEIKLITIENLKREISKEKSATDYVPYPQGYFNMIFKEIQKMNL